ncbi:MAG: hypothetical protein AAGA99_02385 [Actinomycetota bacterium]
MEPLTTTLRRLGDLARLQETMPGITAVDATAGLTTARELAEAAKAFEASRDGLAPADRELVERARLALVSGWMTSGALERLAADPSDLRSWLDTAGEIDEL